MGERNSTFWSTGHTPPLTSPLFTSIKLGELKCVTVFMGFCSDELAMLYRSSDPSGSMELLAKLSPERNDDTVESQVVVCCIEPLSARDELKMQSESNLEESPEKLSVLSELKGSPFSSVSKQEVDRKPPMSEDIPSDSQNLWFSSTSPVSIVHTSDDAMYSLLD